LDAQQEDQSERLGVDHLPGQLIVFASAPAESSTADATRPKRVNNTWLAFVNEAVAASLGARSPPGSAQAYRSAEEVPDAIPEMRWEAMLALLGSKFGSV
jgi:hypothetical protein